MKVFVNGVLYDANDTDVILLWDTDAERVATGAQIASMPSNSGTRAYFQYPDGSHTNDEANSILDEVIGLSESGIKVNPAPNTKWSSPCLDKAYDDEPIFVLRAKDPAATETIYHWMRNGSAFHSVAKIEDAGQVVAMMNEWRDKNADKL